MGAYLNSTANYVATVLYNAGNMTSNDTLLGQSQVRGYSEWDARLRSYRCCSRAICGGLCTCPANQIACRSSHSTAPPHPSLQNITTLTAGQQVPLTSLWGPMDTQALALGYLANDTVTMLLQ